MATENLEEIVEKLSNLKVIDLAKLKNMLEDKWEVSAAAPAAVAVAAAPAAGSADAEEEATDFQITLTGIAMDKKISVIKLVREIVGVNLREAKEIAENTPRVLKESAPKAEAEEIVKKFEAIGAKVTIKGL